MKKAVVLACNFKLPEMELQVIQQNIFNIRGCRIMLDFHLAELYEVETKVLKQAVRRNISRFPEDFMFELTRDEINLLTENIRSQNVTFNWPSITYTPFAFTEQGVAMLSSVLRSDRAIKVNIEIMKAFVMLRQIALQYKDIVTRIDEMEKHYDEQFKEVFTALKFLLEPPKEPRKPIGFK